MTAIAMEASNKTAVTTSSVSAAMDCPKDILGIQRTLRQLGVEDHPEASPDSTTVDEEEQEELSDDFVPLHLVSVSPGRHCGFGSRRRSDPGRMPLYAIRSPLGSSDSSEDDEMERSPRARSPRRYYLEDECYPTFNALTLEGRLPAGFLSPRRRMYTTKLEDSPRRARTMRSNSLPLPDRSGMPIGEAIGALADTAAKANSAQSRQAVLKRGRCFSTTDEHILEAILEESGAQKPLSLRRYSVPNHPHRVMRKLVP